MIRTILGLTCLGQQAIPRQVADGTFDVSTVPMAMWANNRTADARQDWKTMAIIQVPYIGGQVGVI